MTEKGYRVLKPGTVLVDHGPITMVIATEKKGEPFTRSALEGAREAILLLKILSACLPAAKLAVSLLDPEKDRMYPEILQRMIGAVRALGEDDFTPMAAVAGSFSDLVLARTIAAGADRVYVNNGGDIALHLGGREDILRVGVLQDLAIGKVTHVIPVCGMDGIGGIATSGFGGRSLTKGVASAVTVLAVNAVLADAAATAVANAANCFCPEAVRCPAQELDDLTDIYGHMVTKEVGLLNPESIQEALDNGFRRLRELCAHQVVKGGAVFVRGRMKFWPPELAISPVLPAVR